MIAYRNPQYTNGRAAGSAQSVVELCDPVYYVSPLVTLTKRGYTNVAEVESRGSLLAMPRQGNVYGVKHYFEGERRICSAIGGGFTHVEWDSIDASQDKVVAPICDELFPLLDDGVEEAMHCVELNDIHLSGRLIYRMLWLEATKPQDDPEPVYYYHNDHLGGTAYLTDQTGQVAQTLAYLPYGEDWVDVTAFMYDTSQIGFYQFNGKEKDPETDYLYYGARYYWPDAWNGWLSPDPLMDKYPNISPYAYCNWNPVIFVDPDGEFPAHIHAVMVFRACMKMGVSIGFLNILKMCWGASITADVHHSGCSQVHLDGYNNSKYGSNPQEDLISAYNNAITAYQKALSEGDFYTAGEALHTIGDFYSHSNYIELYDEYSEGKTLPSDIKEIPTFSEAQENDDFMSSKGSFLKTGCWPDNKDDFQNSHEGMSKDSKRYNAGGKHYRNTKINRHKAAKETAQKAINKIVGGEK